MQLVPLNDVYHTKSGRQGLNEAGPNNPPTILKRNKGKDTHAATASCHIPSTEVQRVKHKNKVVEAHGPMQLRESTREKRRQSEEARNKKPPKTKIPRNNKKAHLTNESGLVDVQVTFEHCSKVAQVTGFQTSQVIKVLQEDNAERQQANLDDHVTDYDPEECDFVFNSDSEFEGDSDLE